MGTRACVVAVVSFASGLIGATAVAQPGGGPPPARVRLDPVRLESIVQYRDVTGELRAAHRSRVASKEPGLVVEMLVEVGDEVQKGQVLARLDDQLTKLQVSRQEATVESKRGIVGQREAELERVDRDVRRRKSAQTQGGVNAAEVEDAETEVKSSQAKLVEARADLASATNELDWWKRRLADLQIRAPLHGTVVSKSTEVGEWIAEGDKVVEIVDLETIDAYLEVPERFIAALTASDAKVQVRVTAVNRIIESPVTAVISDGDRMARTFPVRLRLQNSDGLIRPGMSVMGTVPTGTVEPSLTIHKDAVRRNDAGEYVYFDANGAAAVAPVETLFASGDRLAVRSPVLKPGMNVVVEGNERLFPTQPLAPMDGAPPGAPAGKEAGPAAGSPEASAEKKGS
ncbi:MAG TPA: efflux RND transporter periplasmic adaptor subunit [Phycisphaerales bacterium]|nr:efflux RND transporter periplasmic adaptor subunit [Phycisphaerales bacterium]